MSNEQKLREALRAVIAAHDACMRELGEQMRAANITNFRVDGQTVLDSFAAIEQARQALATTEPEPTGMPELHPVAHIELGDDSHDVVTLDAAKAYAAAVVQQYKEDAKRYRWLADSNNYYEAINLISDGSLTEDALGKAIDAAMAQGVKG